MEVFMKTKTLLTAIFTICASLLFAQPKLPFTAYSNNPVLTHGEAGSWDQGDIIWSFMFTENDTNYLYYSSSFDAWSQPSSIGLAISTDGYEFTKSEYNPIFEPDGTGFDSWSVCFSVVIEDNGEYILYYNGRPNAGTAMGPYIGKATADNPEWPWYREDDPIIEPGSTGEWDSQGCYPESVIKTDSGLLLYYTGGLSIGHYRVGMAYFDGNTWVKYDDPTTTSPPYAESDPVLELGDAGDWDDQNAALCNVYKTAAGLEMFYTGTSNDLTNIGHATSTNGIDWEKHPENPIFSYVDDPFAVSQGYYVVANPTVMIKDNMYYMYYDYGLLGPGYICLAIADVATGIDEQIDLCSGSSMNILPNPIREETTVSYFVKSKSHVKLSIHNINGQLISTLLDEVLQLGDKEVVFNTTGLPAGVYFCVLKTNYGIQTKKIIKL